LDLILLGILLDDADFFCGADDNDGLIDGTAEAVTVD